MTRIIKYVFYDILRTRFVALYSLFLLVSTVGLFQLDTDTSKVILSLLNVKSSANVNSVCSLGICTPKDKLNCGKTCK